jgi:hypothetical protein
LIGSQEQADAARKLQDLFHGDNEGGGVRDDFGSPYAGSVDLFGENGMFAGNSFSESMGKLGDYLGLEGIDGWDVASVLASGIFGPIGSLAVKAAEQVYGYFSGDGSGSDYAGYGSGWSPGSYGPDGTYSAGDNAGGGMGGSFGDNFSGGDFGFGGADPNDFGGGFGNSPSGPSGAGADSSFGAGFDVSDVDFGFAGGGPVSASSFYEGSTEVLQDMQGRPLDPEIAHLIAVLLGEEDDLGAIDDFVARNGPEALREIVGFAQGGGVFEPVTGYDPIAQRGAEGNWFGQATGSTAMQPSPLPQQQPLQPQSMGALSQLPTEPQQTDLVGGPTKYGRSGMTDHTSGRPFGDPFTDLTGPGARGRAIAASRRVSGPGRGMDDSVPAMINGQAPAALSDGEHVLSADVVSMLGDGSSDAGHRMIEEFAASVRQQKTGSPMQAPPLGGGRFR